METAAAAAATVSEPQPWPQPWGNAKATVSEQAL